MYTRNLKYNGRFYLALCVALGLWLLWQPSPARADTITVTSTLDAGAGTLRQAIADANAGDTIVFTGSMTITLSSELGIAKNLTIDGSGYTVTVSGNDVVRVFKVSNSARVTLDNLAVVHGLGDTTVTCAESGSCGGGLYNDNGIVAIHAVTFTAHAANLGAALYNHAGQVSIATSVISGNATVSSGGGVFNAAFLTVAESTVANNSTSSSSGGQGGGIYNANTAALTVTHTTFQGNTPTGAGAGVSNVGTASIAHCRFIENSTPSIFGGGGIHNYGNITVTDSIFSRNSVDNDGGAINNQLGTASIANSTFTANSAANGGAIANRAFYNDLNLVAATCISNSTFTGNSAENGGAVYNLAKNNFQPVAITATLSLVNSTIAGNRAQNGGGVASHVVDGFGIAMANLTMKNSIVYSNTATGTGPNCTNSGATLVGNAHNLFPSVVDGCPLGAADVATAGAVETIMSALADNGGPTPTRALVAGSPALDAGDDAVCPAADQRGLARPYGAACDIGAYEAAAELGLTKTVTPTIDIAHHGLLTYTVVLSNGGVLSDTHSRFTDTLTTLPVTFAGWVVSPANTSLSNGEITWSGTLTAGEAITWTWAVTHTGDYADMVTNTAEFSGTAMTGVAQAAFSVEEPATLYVDADATGAATGFSWTDAFTNVQDALNYTNAHGDSTYEIWVAEGVYYPDEGAGAIADSPTMSFTLRYNNVQLYGGFAATETLRAQRDWDARPTILSGDLQQDDTTVNGVVTSTGAIAGANAYHVLYLDGTTTPITGTTAIDGFVITAGKAYDTPSPDPSGGGIYNYYSNPTLTNITFSGNYADWGGGMCNDYSDPTLTHVTFSGNQALGGGGIYNFDSDPTLTHVTFSDNRAEYSGSGGGGMYNYMSNPTLTHVTFSDNRAEDSGGGGGGIYNEASSLTLTNVTLWGNRANYGGGIYNDSSDLTLTNVTLSGNRANDGGGMYNFDSDPTLTNVTLSGNYAGLGGGMYNEGSNPTLINVILWGNYADSGGNDGNELYNDNAAPVLSYTLVATATGDIYNDTSTVTYGDGMLYTDPQFVAPITATAAPTTTGDYRLRAGSLAIDAGDNAAITVTTDLDGNPRIYNGVVDMGAYEAHSALVLGKSVTPTTNVAYHSLVTYTVVLSNSGFADDPQVLFTNTLTTLPVAFASWVISPAHTLLSNGEITWRGTVTTGEAITWTWAVTHTGDYAETVTNTARFSGTQQTGQAQAGFSVEPNYVPVLGVIGDRSVDELTELAFTATATDANVNDTLTFTLDAGSVGSITPGGAFTWTPTEAEGPGVYTATVRVSDGTLDDAETFTLTVADVNAAPVLDAIGNKTVDELTELAFNATAADADLPAQPLTYTLDAGSVGSITTGGDYTWTPTEAEGPGTYTATVRVTDGVLEDVEMVTITVNEVNTAPALDAIGAKTVDELTELAFTATATDADLPAQPLTYTLDAGSAGSITPGGAFTWTPTEAEGPGVYTATVRVSDGALEDVEMVTITVSEVNTAPTLVAIGNKTVDELTELAFTATATDADLPAQPLTYTLDAGSAGSITPGGAFTWTPGEADGPGVYTATVSVSDGELEASETFSITVNKVNVAPAADAGADQYAALGDEVTLDGSGSSDLDTNDSLTYGWTQTGGAAVTLSDASAVSPTFIANVTGPLTFQLTVTDTGILTDHDTVTVTIIDDSLDLCKTVTMGPMGLVPIDSIITYTLHLTNTSEVTFTQVMITDTLEAGLTYIVDSVTPAPDSSSGRQIIWSDVTEGAGLTPGASLTITYAAMTGDTTGNYANDAQATGTYIGGVTSAEDRVTVAVSDTFQLRVSPDHLYANGLDEATVSIKAPPYAGREIALTAQLGSLSVPTVTIGTDGRASATYMAAYVPGGATDVITASIGHQAITAPVVLKNNPLHGQFSSIFNSDLISYTLVVSNSSATPTSGVVLTGTVPANTVFITATGGVSVTVNSQLYIVSVPIGELASGDAYTMTWAVRIPRSFLGEIVAEARATSKTARLQMYARDSMYWVLLSLIFKNANF